MSDLSAVSGKRLIVDLLYLTDRNLFGRPLYRDLDVTDALLHRDAGPYLARLDDILARRDLYLVIYDAYRPLAAQQAMWDILPDDRYVAHPSRGSKHNRGGALDVYLLNGDKTPLAFPTAIDGYYPGCQTDLPAWLTYLERAHHGYRAAGLETECANRDLLKGIMEEAGFVPLQEEWWHYELPHAADYPLIAAYPAAG